MTASPTTAATTWTDTRDMDWGTFPGLGAGLVKPLHVDEDGTVLAMIVHLPPGSLGIEIPHRHYHATVCERSYHLGGDLPHAEWAEASDDHELVVFRERYFLDRRPGSLHGLDHLVSQTGAVLICWRNGAGNWLDEPNAPTETLDVEFETEFVPKDWDEVTSREQSDGVVIHRAGAKVLDTRDMPWEPFGDGLGRVKTLSVDAEGNTATRIIFLPPGQEAPAEALVPGDDFECAFVVEGELTVDTADGPQQVRPGWFMERAPGSPYGVDPVAASGTGAMLLQFRVGSGAWSAPFDDFS